jgi:hypothetical protein
MGQNKSEVSPHLARNKKTIAFQNAAAIEATVDPLLRFTAQTGMTPLSLRCTPYTEFDRSVEDETYVLSLEDDTVKISTSNTAVATATKTSTIEATFTAGTHIAKDSVLEIVVTLGGDGPIIPARSLFEFEYLVG